MVAINSAVRRISRPIENGLLLIIRVSDVVISMLIIIQKDIYKYENWTHSLSFKGFSAPYTTL
jgi:hypothetical protein